MAQCDWYKECCESVGVPPHPLAVRLLDDCERTITRIKDELEQALADKCELAKENLELRKAVKK